MILLRKDRTMKRRVIPLFILSFLTLLIFVNTSGKALSSTISGDINGDGEVNLSDLVILANAYGSTLGNPLWNANAGFEWKPNHRSGGPCDSRFTLWRRASHDS